MLTYRKTKLTNVILCIVLLLVLSLVIVSQVFALDDEVLYRSDELLIRQVTSGDIKITNPSNLQTLTTRLHLLPIEDYRQVIVEQNFEPQPLFVDESLVQYKFSKPVPSQIKFSIETMLRTRNTYKQITRRVDYPVYASKIPDELTAYLSYTDLIDTNDKIQAKAKEIAGNSNDLFEVSFNIAQWVSNNIDYDLETLTADATQKATWVYANKKGVCDELSVLYASMMRSLGIPTRFVSGISYTNSPLFRDPWSPHAWVEVYFPDYGWVPFDLTYKQFGFIDASHISMQTSADANESATQYQWQGYSLDRVSINPSALDFNITLVDARSKIEDFAKPNISLLRDKISLTSSSAIVVTLQNTKNYYVSAQLTVAAPNELLFTNGRQIQVLLKPFEVKTIIIPVSVAPGLVERYTYEFPIAITNFYRTLSNTTLYVSAGNPTYDALEIKAMSANALAVVQSSLSSTIKPECYVNSSVLVNKSVLFTCNIKNDAKQTLTDVSVCVSGTCIKESINAFSTQKYSFKMNFTSVGIKQVPVRISVNSYIQETITDVVVEDEADLSIIPVVVANTIKYDEKQVIRLLLQKNSYASPKNTIVRIFDRIPYIWNVGTLSANRELSVEISGSSLKYGLNTIPITAEFVDERGVSHKYKTTIQIELVDATILQRIIILLKEIIA